METTRNVQEALERRRRAKEAGTYSQGASSHGNRNVQEALARRQQAKANGTYQNDWDLTVPRNYAVYTAPQEKKQKKTYTPETAKTQAEENIRAQHGSYEEFAAKQKEKAPYTPSGLPSMYDALSEQTYQKLIAEETEKLLSGSDYYGLTNKTYQKYLDDLYANATQQKQFDWLEEQKTNLETLRNNPEVYEAVKAYRSAQWNPLAYMEKHDAQYALEQLGYDEEGIKSLVDTYSREENAAYNEHMMEEADKTTDAGLAGKAVGHLRSIGANLTSILATPQGWANAINEKLTSEYNPLDTNSYWHTSGDYRDRARQNITEDITKEQEYAEQGKNVPLHRDALGKVYQAGTSVFDNILTGGAFGQAGALAVMGSQAAQSTMKDAFTRTGDNAKSALTGTAAGLIEAGTEKLSLDHLWDMAKGAGKTLTRSMLANWIAQSGIEGVEEITAEGLNTLVDRWINQEDSNYERNVQNYINQGMDEETARDHAFNDTLKQMGEAGVVGAVAGGMSGGLAVGANKLGQYGAGVDATSEGQMPSMVAQAEAYEDARVQKALKDYLEKPTEMKAGKLIYEMYAADEIARNEAEKANKGSLVQKNAENRSKGQNSNAQSVSEETQTPTEAQKSQANVENAIARMSEASNAEELADVMHEVEDNGIQEQIQEVRNYYEMRGAQMVVEGKTTNEELAFTGMQLSEAKAYEAGSRNEEVAPEKLSIKGQIAYNEGKQSYIKEMARKNIISNTEEVTGAKATDNTGKELVIQEIVSVGKEPTVRTNDGTVNLKDISFQNEATGLLYNNASTLGSTKAAQAYVRNYPGKIMVNSYQDMAQSIMKDGELGLDINKVLKRRAGAVYWLGEKGVKELYAIGAEKAKESNRQLESVKRKGKGQLKDKRRGKTEEPLMKVLEQIAERTGLDIEVSDKEVSEVRGYFEESLSRIVLNADANMFETVFHELGEFTDSWNTEGMREFQSALLDWYFETQDNDKMQSLIESVQKVYKQQEGSKTYREAANEIVNDAISGLFATETGAKDFAEWLGKNRTETETKTILQTIVDFLQDICNAIRTYIAGHNLSATTRSTMEMNEKRAKRLRQQLLDAIDQAVENYQTAEVREVSASRVKHSYVNEKIKKKAEQFKKEGYKNFERVKVLDVTPRINAEVKRLIGFDATGYEIYSNTDTYKHIEDRHGEKGKRDQSMKDMRDVALMGYVLEEFDSAELVLNSKGEADTTNAFVDKNGKPSKMIKFSKEINGVQHVVVATPENGYKKLWVLSEYIEQKKDTSQTSHGKQALPPTPEANPDNVSSKDSISKTGENATKRFHSLNDAVAQAEKLFAEEYDAWDKINPTKIFKVAVTSEALKEIGIDDKTITMDSSKIIKIRSKHKGMTDAVIKKIPRVINEPMLILESKTAPSRVVMLGELIDEDGKTVLVVLELNPTNRKGIALDEIKIASAYGKDNLQNFVNASEILYVNPDNTKTSSWLTSTRLQLPVESLTTGLTDSIPSTNSVVKNDLRYSLNDATDLTDFWFNNDNLDAPIGNAASILEEGAKLLQGKEVDTESIRKIARRMIKEYQSNYDVDSLAGNMEKLFSYMQSQEKVSYDDMIRIMTEVTMPVIEESTSVDETQQEIYRNFKANLRKMNIKLSATQKQEVAYYYDSYENFRRKMFGTIPLSEKGISLDEQWLEISQMSNGVLDPIVNEGDQPLRLVEALEQMKPQVINNFGTDNHGAAMDMALRIYEEYFKAQHSAKVRSLEIKMRKDRMEWQKQERQKFEDGLLKIRNSELQRKYNQEAAEYRFKIKRTGNELIRWMEHPTHQKHVSKDLKGMVLEFLDCIDFVSHRAKEDSDSTLLWKAKMTNISKELYKTDVDVKAGLAENSPLRNFLETLNPDFLPTLDEFLAESSGREKISQMDHAQLKRLEFLTRTMKTAVVKANELHMNRMYRYAADAGTETLRELNARSERKGMNKGLEKITKGLSLDMAEPKTYFERLGKGATSIYKELREGFNRRVFLIREARAYMEEILKDVKPKQLREWIGDDAKVHEVETKDGMIQLSTGQIMSLYLLGKRNQGRAHILMGGICATEVGKSGKRIVQNKAAQVTPEQLSDILKLLTPEQKTLADKMQIFLAKNCAEWGNEVHLQMYEYEMFNDKGYFPIRTIEAQRDDKGKQDDSGNAYAVKNLGFTKSINKKAPQAIWVGDVMDVFVDHVVNMANYNAYLIPLSDAMKWFNFNNAGFEGEYFKFESVHGSIQAIYGTNANQYFKELLYEINGREKRDSKSELTKVLTRNMKKASVMASLSVVIQQPMAYVRAWAVMDARDLLGALNSMTNPKQLKRNAEETIKHSAIAQWKDWGFYEAYMGKSMKEVITGQQSLWEKVGDYASIGAQKADKYTWGVLWNACKKEIARTRTDLTKGSEEFFEAVTERFDEVIDETQVVDSILHKCPLLKTDGLASFETAFMNEPFKSYNMLYRAADHLAREEKGLGKLKKAFANRKFARAAGAYMLSALLTSMAASLIYALRDDKEKKFGERYREALLDTAGDNLNPLSMIPYAKSVISILNGYDMERMDLQGFATIYDAGNALLKRIKEPEKSNWTFYGIAKKMTKGISTVTGSPFYNVWRDAESILEGMAKANVPEYEMIGDLYKDLIWSEEGSTAYERAYRKLQNQKGKTEEEIQKGVRSRLNTMFKEGELTEEEAKEALKRFGYTKVSDIVEKWKENMEK